MMRMKRLSFILFVLLAFVPRAGLQASGDWSAPDTADIKFPLPLEVYQRQEQKLAQGLNRPLSIGEILLSRMAMNRYNLPLLCLFIGAIIHTFLAGKFQRIAHHLESRRRQRDGTIPSGRPVGLAEHLFHYLGEVEVIFGLWLIPVAILIAYQLGWKHFSQYVTSQVSYAEPLFVVVIMAMAATRPVLCLVERLLGYLAGIGHHSVPAWWFSILILAPLLGSFITEPAAITIAALLLSKKFYSLQPSKPLAYGTLGLLFTNISVGGVLTHFAAPPVLIVARRWNWDMAFMFRTFGWKSIIGIIAATTAVWLVFRHDFRDLEDRSRAETGRPNRAEQIPHWVTAIHLLLMAWTVFNLHTPPVFIFSFLVFLAFMGATPEYQQPLSLREPILVGFFLAGLVTHGGLQQWWIEPILGSLSKNSLFLGSLGLSTFNDNAAVTYLTSLVPSFMGNGALQYAVVAGAITGGGLTVIANAPNPAGQSLLNRHFGPAGISPIGLLLGALAPTAILAACFLWL